MKKSLTISFLLLLFFSQPGYYFIYVIQQYQLKESIKEKLLATIPEASLDIIDAGINKNDIEWEEEGKEFYLHGLLYDVAAIKIINGRTLIYCLNDKKEEQLLQDLAKAVSSGNDQNTTSKHGGHTVKFQLLDYIILSENTITIGKPVTKKHVDHLSH